MIKFNSITNKLNRKLSAIIILLLAISITGCGYLNNISNDSMISSSESASTEIISNEIINDITDNLHDIATSDESGDSDEPDEASEENIEPLISDSDLVPFNMDEPFSHCSQPVCTYNPESGMIDYTINFTSIPKSDDLLIYLYELANYENESFLEEKKPVASAYKNYIITISLPYESPRLFSRFVPVISIDGSLYPLSYGQFITNPEAIANNTTDYPDIVSKKGILLDPLTIDQKELTDLNVKRVVFNIPLSFIMGETENDKFSTISFDYLGQTYFFDEYKLAGFDSTFKYLTDNNYHVTAIVLNDWNTTYPEIIHPLSRKKTSRSMYYAFNTEEETGVRVMEAAALFLADRYSGNKYGLIHDWVIANEINQQKVWNYMATNDLDLYVESFEKSFRTFYNAIKSNYSNARVYFSIDQDWNNNGGYNSHYFNGKDLLNKLNETAKKGGNYDWGLSIHPYPSPLYNTRFWQNHYDKSENAGVVTPMNLSAITDYMAKQELLDTNGNVRQIGVTELGFSSRAGEKNQAAAFTYCYEIIENNRYINSFLMNRQTDTKDSLRSGLALGIYNPDYSPKYIADAFSNIDGPGKNKYISEMLEIIGAKTLEEALDWAR